MCLYIPSLIIFLKILRQRLVNHVGFDIIICRHNLRSKLKNDAKHTKIYVILADDSQKKCVISTEVCRWGVYYALVGEFSVYISQDLKGFIFYKNAIEESYYISDTHWKLS